MQKIIQYFIDNPSVTFSGIGVSIAAIIFGVIKHFLKISIVKVQKNNKDKKSKFPEQYHQVLSSSKYLKFQEKLLEKYYYEDSKRYIVEVFGEKYYAYYFKANDSIQKYPFGNLCNDLSFKDEKIEKTGYNSSKYQNEYKSIMDTKRPRYDVKGFMLDKFTLNVNGEIEKMSTFVGSYKDNVFTSHILEFELYKIFKKYKNYNLDSDKEYKKVISKMKYRNAIHNSKSIKQVLSSGCNRSALLGVQLIILFKESNGRYKTILIQRSSDVASKPDYYQFVPSGGFEIYDNQGEKSTLTIKENYSVELAIFRELLEEVFGKKEYDVGNGNEDLRKLEEDGKIRYIREMIKNKKVFFEFMGSAIDLVGLRNELSFIMRIDDIEFSKNHFYKNIEGKIIKSVYLDQVENFIDDKKKLNPASAALWKMCINNHLYKEVACK
jgi:hypothetical protein